MGERARPRTRMDNSSSNHAIGRCRILQKEKSNKVLETSGFCEFLNDEQKEPDVDLNAARILIKEYETVLQASKFTTIGKREHTSIYNSIMLKRVLFGLSLIHRSRMQS